MNYKSFNLGDWIGHISGAIEDERELDGNEMRDLVEFLSMLEREPCEDAISRQFMLDLGATCLAARDKQGELTAIVGIEFLPSVQPKVKTGKWVAVGNTDAATCKCGFFTDRYLIYNYCPNCGARMVKPQESEDKK